MSPSETCDVLLSYVKKSNLNFHISESPFSVTINIKKSFIINKNGDSLNGALDHCEVKAFELPEVKIENKSVSNIKTKATLSSEETTIKPRSSNPTQPRGPHTFNILTTW